MFNESMLVRIDETASFMPDVFVTCERIEQDDSRLSDPPVVVIEVLSPTTRDHDLDDKVARIESCRAFSNAC